MRCSGFGSCRCGGRAAAAAATLQNVHWQAATLHLLPPLQELITGTLNGSWTRSTWKSVMDGRCKWRVVLEASLPHCRQVWSAQVCNANHGEWQRNISKKNWVTTICTSLGLV